MCNSSLVGAQVCDPLISCVWHVNFGWLSTNNPTWLQGVSSDFVTFFDSFRYSFHAFDLQLLFVGAQVCDPLIDCFWACKFRWLSMNTPAWLQDVSFNICIDSASSHYSLYDFDVQLFFCRCSGMRPTDWLCVACWFRVAMNEQSGMTTGREFQYLRWVGLLSLLISWLWCATILLSALRY